MTSRLPLAFAGLALCANVAQGASLGAGSLAPTAKPSATTPVDHRAPTAADDSARGYAVNNLWNDLGGTGLWIALDVTPGNARWQRVPDPPLPLDAVPGVWQFACSPRKLRAAYTGMGENIAAGATATAAGTDVGFRSDSSPDTAAMDAVLAGGGGVGRVETCYDQSGAGNNATAVTGTQPSSGGMPTYGPAVRGDVSLGNTRAFVFDGTPYTTGATGYVAFATAMQIGTGLSVTGRNHSAYMTLTGLPRTGSIAIMYGPPGTSSGTPLLSNYQFSINGLSYNNYGATTSSKPQMASPGLVGYTDGAAQTVYNNDVVTSTGQVSGGTSAATGATIGAGANITTSTAATKQGLQATNLIAISNVALTSAQQLAFEESVTFWFGLTPQVRNTVVWFGDSLVDSFGSVYGQTVARQADRLIGKPHRTFDFGVFGQTLEQRFADWANAEAPAVQPGATNVLVLEGSWNDYFAGETPAQVYAELQTIVAAAHAAGYKVLRVGLSPDIQSSSTPAEQTFMQQLYALELGNPSLYDAFVNIMADSIIGGASGMATPSLGLSDGLHYTPTGYAYYAGLISSGIAGLLGP